MWFNPFLAQVDVMCGTETGFGTSCQVVAGVTNHEQSALDANTQAFGPPRDSYWPRSLLAMVAAAVVLIVLSVQLVSPTRRWRLRRPRPSGGAAAVRSPEEPVQAVPTEPIEPSATIEAADPGAGPPGEPS
jgi:hypothetical protein